ncbi:MAG: hypothetical protein K2H53_04000, partial [Clostridia bacterium]|nr:hypothetical protein [Clostridia bacterium]
ILGKNKQDTVQEIQKEPRDTVKFFKTPEGMEALEYYNANPRPGQFYDTTRIVINNKARIIENTEIYDLWVSHFNETDVVFLDDSGKESGSRTDYKHIIASIDPELIKTDPDYIQCLVKGLLERNRVEDFISKAMKDEEELEKTGASSDMPHGMYVGCVTKVGESYKKGFDPRVGRAMHEAPEMKAERAKYKERQKEIMKENVQRRQAEINRLQAEIDEYQDKLR